MFGYRLHLEADDNGTVLVTCPTIPELTTYGPAGKAGEEQLLRNADAALAEALAARIAGGRSIPDPDGLVSDAPGVRMLASLDPLSQLKVELYQALEAEAVSRAELARRLGWHREQVDRLFRLDHLSKVDQLQAAAQAVGYRVDAHMMKEVAGV